MTPNIQPDPGMPYAPPVQQRGWFSRHWMWFIPAGCLTMIVLVVVFVGVIFGVVAGAMKSSDAYKMAAYRAEHDPRVIDALGSPVKEGMFTSGNINVNGGSGQADLSVSLSGSKDKGKLYLTATKAEGNWTFSNLKVKVDGTGDTIDLLEQPAAP